MTSGEEFDALARSHMATQVHGAAAAQVLIGRTWDAVVDPTDLDRSFARFSALAVPVVTQARTLAESDAQTYYSTFRTLAGLEGEAPRVAPVGTETDRVTTGLYVTGYGAVKRRIGEGMDPAEALAATRTGMLGAVKRQTVAAGRDRLIELGVADPQVSGWARVSDGHPCAFCAMLIGRGPVYSARTVAFRAHDACGCNVRLVPANRSDPANGWAPDARAIAAFAARTGLSLAADYAGFRLAYAAESATAGSSLASVLASTAAGAATASAIKASAYALAA